jgi:ribosomal protein S18 acetylase RimI-like enzyme
MLDRDAADHEDQERAEEPVVRIREICDEADPAVEPALELIAASFAARERQPLAEIRSEIEEKRLGLLDPFDFHLIVGEEDGRVIAAASGVYLAGVNAGFITYLAVDREARAQGVGSEARAQLVDAFEADARRAGRESLAWVLGEVRLDSPWLVMLVRERGAIVFDLDYYHPGMRGGPGEAQYALYREPVGDRRPIMPATEVGRVLYAIWRRGYRVRYPLERDRFRAMIDEFASKLEIGARAPSVAD